MQKKWLDWGLSLKNLIKLEIQLHNGERMEYSMFPVHSKQLELIRKDMYM